MDVLKPKITVEFPKVLEEQYRFLEESRAYPKNEDVNPDPEFYDPNVFEYERIHKAYRGTDLADPTKDSAGKLRTRPIGREARKSRSVSQERSFHWLQRR